MLTMSLTNGERMLEAYGFEPVDDGRREWRHGVDNNLTATITYSRVNDGADVTFRNARTGVEVAVRGVEDDRRRTLVSNGSPRIGGRARRRSAADGGLIDLDHTASVRSPSVAEESLREAGFQPDWGSVYVLRVAGRVFEARVEGEVSTINVRSWREDAPSRVDAFSVGAGNVLGLRRFIGSLSNADK